MVRLAVLSPSAVGLKATWMVQLTRVDPRLVAVLAPLVQGPFVMPVRRPSRVALSGAVCRCLDGSPRGCSQWAQYRSLFSFLGQRFRCLPRPPIPRTHHLSGASHASR